MIEIHCPNKEELLKKWEKELEAVAHLNKWDLPEELAFWAEYATHCTNLLELGAYNGASTKIMMLANPELKITVIDLWEDNGTYETFKDSLREDLEDGNVTYARGITEKGLEIMNRHLGRPDWIPFDGLLVDAGHTEDLVTKDIQMSLPLMKPGCLLTGHDFHPNWEDNGVAKAVKKLLPGHFNPMGSIWACWNRTEDTTPVCI
jgi:predicted O-methyltransferase YrrM